jgi:hypothetical protein
VSDGHKHPDDLAVLVDDHLLDSYLAIAALRPRRAWLVHAARYAREARRLAQILDRAAAETVLVRVDDDTDTHAIGVAYARLPADVHLHHTGGSGSIAAQMRVLHADAGHAPSQSSFLDEERRLLRRDDGSDTRLVDLVDETAVDFSLLVELNGFSVISVSGHPDEDELVERAAAAVDWPPADTFSGRDAGDQAMALLRAALADVQPTEGPLADNGRWEFFCSGKFFEYLVADAVRVVAPRHELITGVRLERGRTAVELDVVTVGHYRPYVISCTAGDNPHKSRAKLFEVMLRARQVGGTTARAAVASTLHDESRTPTAEMEDLANTGPLPAQRPAVFGLAEIVGWLRGEDGARARLEAFLSS